MTYCNYCNVSFADDAPVCPYCGQPTQTTSTYMDTISQYVQEPYAQPVGPNAPLPPQGHAAPYGYGPGYAPGYGAPPISDPVARQGAAGPEAEKPDYIRKEVVRIKGLYKKYSKKADWAVTNVTFSCYSGEIVGLLGHNGAGKSTTLKCLEGMLPYERGQILINGHDIRKDPLRAKADMGFVTDNHAVFIKMTGLQYLDFMADVYKVPTELRVKRIQALEKVFQLGDAVYNLVSSYSHGMRQKVCMMGSLIHHPKLWILDEPMTGLDPRTMHAVQEFMHKYANAGNTIIFSSHALNTVAKLCDRVVLIRKGAQISDLNVKQIYASDPNFDFEEYFLRNERQD